MKEIDKLNFRPFTRFCMSIGAVPTSYLAGMTIEEQLLWLCSYLEKEVIPAVNNNAEAVEELQGLFTQLHDYVEHYFDNLDVQEEINNKLDDMVEQGTLQEIISQYLNSRAVFGFDSVEAMAESVNLIDGSYARTYGFYNKNDGGGALYKIREITNDDVVNGITIIALVNDNTLVAELITEDSMPIECFGVTGSDEDDDSDYTNIALETNVKELVFNNTYTLKGLKLNNNITIKGLGTINVLHTLGGFTDGYLAVDKNNITIDGLTFNMRTSGKLYFKDCDNVVIKNCKINSYNSGWNVHLLYCNNCYVTNNIIITDGKAYDDGIHVAGENIFITENYIQNGEDISVVGGDDSIAVGVASDFEEQGKVIKNIVISNNVLQTVSRCINIYSFTLPVSDIIIDNNKCNGRLRISYEGNTTYNNYLFTNIYVNDSSFTSQISSSTYCCMLNHCQDVYINNCQFDSKYNNVVHLGTTYKNINFNSCEFYTRNYATDTPSGHAVFYADADSTNHSQLSLNIKNCIIDVVTKILVNGANTLNISNNTMNTTLTGAPVLSVYNSLTLENVMLLNNSIVNNTANQTQTLLSMATGAAACTVLIANNVHNFGNDAYWAGSPITKIVQNDKPFTLTIPS